MLSVTFTGITKQVRRALWAGIASAALMATSVQAAVIPAKPISQDGPEYPFDYRTHSIEGWVQVSFMVNEQGKVEDALVHDSSGHELFEQAALAAVAKWQYQPATRDGKPVQQSIAKEQLNFRLSAMDSRAEDKRNDEVDKRFLSRYKRALSAIEKGKLKKAAGYIEDLENREKRKWLESSYLWVAKAYLYEAQGDSYNVADVLSKVVANGSSILPRGLYVEVLKKYFTANVMTNNLAEAKAVFEMFQEFAPGHKALASLQPYYDQVVAYLASDQVLEIVAMVPERGLWHHHLTRRNFEIVSAGAPLENVELRCDHQQKSFTGVSKQSIETPADWGDCYVYVDGKGNTQFSIIEI